MPLQYFIGTSGWHYSHWKNRFYPPGLPANQWLSYYAQHFNTVEINASFYRLPLESTFATWHQAATPGFCYAVKASRFITHIKRLKECEEPWQKFISHARSLEANLGPILFQLPAGFHRDDDRLRAFLTILDPDYKYVFEFRHESWMNSAVFEILREHHAGFCVFDMPGFSSPVISTSEFAYFRFHGRGELYSGSYPDQDLTIWSQKIQALSPGLKTIYIYFNNDAGGAAIANALTLRKMLIENK